MLSRREIEAALRRWHQAWAGHDLDGVMGLFHEEVLFENWTGGKAEGKDNLRRAWSEWFARHGGFRFTEEETFIDELQQKVLYRWQLEWPSMEKGCEGRNETQLVPAIYLCFWKITEGKQPGYGKMLGYAYTLHGNTFEANWEKANNS